MKRITGSLPLCVLVTLACGRAPLPEPPRPAPPAAPVRDSVQGAPWKQAPLAASAAPGVFLAQWRKADNRATCAPLAPATAEAGATPRAASFAGGWAVAYDLPQLRSAFGIAGTGVLATAPSYTRWPHHLRWADGSTAGYGFEGGVGPKQLAYLRIAGQDCLYNVWSSLGKEHLESLLARLRFVRVPAGATKDDSRAGHERAPGGRL